MPDLQGKIGSQSGFDSYINQLALDMGQNNTKCISNLDFNNKPEFKRNGALNHSSQSLTRPKPKQANQQVQPSSLQELDRMHSRFR